MKKLIYLILAVVGLTTLYSCLGHNVYDEYKDWREKNDAWFEQQKASGQYTLLTANWDPSAHVLIRWPPACTIGTQAQAVCKLLGADSSSIKVIGLRPGEKMYETLLTKEEAVKAEDMGEYYRVPFGKPLTTPVLTEEFNSDNARLLSLEEIKATIERALA